jgi:solute carrier family 25 (mitochondrial citrate transporter), member 1
MEKTRTLSNKSTGFVAFDAYKSLLEGPDGKISGPRTVIAGFGAGITESLLAVTPFESIKTQLYGAVHTPPPSKPT